ncbi:hypothetical protein [Streptomyces sp. BH104]|uniref:hypothetical protein n=1 Tax=Streptomyces sp. BH104 TaxID=3410407 RepID=UPI003BB50370
MRDIPRDLRSPAEVAWLRAAESEDPDRYLAVIGRTVAALEAGADIATQARTPHDPTDAAAEIEALAGARRLNTCRKDRT